MDRAGRWLAGGQSALVLAIAYSTLATRQHVALDVAAGIGWGLVAAWLTHLADHARNQPNLNATQLAPA